jgi:hypothetical protein
MAAASSVVSGMPGVTTRGAFSAAEVDMRAA